MKEVAVSVAIYLGIPLLQDFDKIFLDSAKRKRVEQTENLFLKFLL